MGMTFVELPEVDIHHLALLDLSIIAYLAPHTRDFYENAVSMMLPMDDPDVGAIHFKNPDEDFTFEKGRTFELVDKALETIWYCQVVRTEDENGCFIGRVIPIPPLPSYADDDMEHEQRPQLKLISGTKESC